jgi:hypothetical protein
MAGRIAETSVTEGLMKKPIVVFCSKPQLFLLDEVRDGASVVMGFSR